MSDQRTPREETADIGLVLGTAEHVFAFMAGHPKILDIFMDEREESGKIADVSRETIRHNFEVLTDYARKYAEDYAVFQLAKELGLIGRT